MKILFICNKGEIGGATKSLLTLVQHLKNMGVEPILITPCKNGNVMQYCENNNIRCYYIKFFEVGYSLNTSLFKKVIKILLLPYFYFGSNFINKFSVKNIMKTLDMTDIDYIHTNVNRDNIGILLSEKTGIKNIMHLREYGTLDFNCIYVRKNIYEFMNQKVDKFIAISNSIKDFFIDNGIDENKIVTIYNGIDYSDIITKNYLEERNNFLKIVILSGISESKGQIQVIEAINKLPHLIKKNLKLDLYGSGNKEYIYFLKKKISGYGLEDVISFKGYQENISSILHEYDLAITPSKSEAFGRVTVEYMFAKLPVIVSNTGANMEIVENKKTGLIYEYNNIDDLKNKILLLYKNSDFREMIGMNGYFKAKQKFCSLENAMKIKQIYLEKY